MTAHLLSAAELVLFAAVNGYVLLWGWRNWQRSKTQGGGT